MASPKAKPTPKSTFKFPGEGNMPTKYPSKFRGEGNMPKKKPTPKATSLTGPAAVAELKKQVSRKGVAAAEAKARKAIEAKYPGLYIPETRIARTADEARKRNQAKYGR